MKTKLKELARILFLSAPLILGFIGYLQAGESVSQAIYASLCLYGMGQKEMPANIVIEIARWIAPLATASTVFIVARSVRRRIREFISACTSDSVAVRGPKAEKEAMLKRLGRRGIDMENSPVNANHYILLGDEVESLSFYRNHLKDKKAEVFVQCSSLPEHAEMENLRLFCPERTASRVFWDKHCPYELFIDSNRRLDIVIIGFEKLARELLLSALHVNVFSVDQNVTYHIFGKERGFSDTYHELHNIPDRVVFHKESWKKATDLIADAEMVIVAKQKDQFDLLNDLMLAIPAKNIYVLSAQPVGVELLAKSSSESRLIPFDWKGEALDPHNILRLDTVYYAKKLFMMYSPNAKGIDEEWMALSAQNRYSYLRAADFRQVAKKLLGDRPLDAESLEELAMIEHERWCRYHYLNNWTYGEKKDFTLRTHPCLVEYNALSDRLKESDRINIRYLLQLN
ncbi:MAG: hypothetical protein IJN63_10090 [Clostridia bacterium]|nr:hypothetical protein [Clostridia bacterium]